MRFIGDRSHREQKGSRGPSNPQWLGAFLARRGAWMAATALLVFVLSLSGLLSQPRKYTATAIMLLHPELSRDFPGPNAGSRAIAIAVDSQAEILRSPFMMRRLFDSLALHNDPEWISNPPRDAAAPEETPARQNPQARLRERVVKRLAAAIDVRRRPTGMVVQVSATSANPQRAARIANKLVELFVDYRWEQLAQTTEPTHTPEWFCCMPATIASPASAPTTPSSPNLALALALSIGLGLVSGLVVGLFSELR